MSFLLLRTKDGQWHWLPNDTWLSCWWITNRATYGNLFEFEFFSTRQTFQTIFNKIGIFYLFWPCRTKQFDLWPFLKWLWNGLTETAGLLLTWVKPLFFWRWPFDKKKKMGAFFEFDLYTNYFVTPGFNCRNIVRMWPGVKKYRVPMIERSSTHIELC